MILESVRLALGRLQANAARSALTIIGVVIGVGAIVTLVAVGNGSAADVNDQFAALGANTLTVSGGRGFSRGLRGAAGSGTPITMTDAQALAHASTIRSVAPVVQGQYTISANGTSQTSAVQGTTPEVQSIDSLDLRSGTFFSAFANARRLPVAVIGATLADDLAVDPTNGAGTVVDVNGSRFVLVGVLQPKGGVGFLNPDDDLIVPLGSMEGRLVSSEPNLNQIRVAAAPGKEKQFGQQVTDTIRGTHKLGTNDANDFLVIDPTSLVQARKESSATFTRLLTAVAGISLVVGGIGIANVMLVAVRERTREIGIRRAVGARRRDVLLQFLTEAAMLSLVGGLIGVAGGTVVAYLVPHFSSQRTVMSWPAAILAFGASGLVGILAGLGPANQAAGLEPAAALRYE